MGGQQPYAINPEGPLFRLVTEGLARSVDVGTIEPFVAALEESAGGRCIQEDIRAVYLEQDPVAMNATSSKMVSEGDIAPSLGSWQMPCLIFAVEEDSDFVDQARRASEEIPGAEFVLVPAAGHLASHLSHDVVLPAILRSLRRG
jgi:pimeloyl-ACP methyl ester carboxylesterase